MGFINWSVLVAFSKEKATNILYSQLTISQIFNGIRLSVITSPRQYGSLDFKKL